MAGIEGAFAQMGAAAAQEDSRESKKKPEGRPSGDNKKSDRDELLRGMGKRANQAGVDRLQELSRTDTRVRSDDKPRYQDVPSFKRGGTKRKAGVARLHKGETIERGKKKRGKKGRE